MAEPTTPTRPRNTLGDLLFRLICQAAGILVILIVLVLAGVLTYQSWPVLSSLGKYKVFAGSDWNPNAEPPVFGAIVFLFGTLATSLIAMLIAVPLGVGAAAYLSEIAPPWIRKTCSFLIELLAAIPSVVYGFWGLFFLAPAINWLFVQMGGSNRASGQGIFAAGVILAIMIVPYITAISYDVCRAVPRSQREGALALGATRWQMIWTVVLPYARPGIIAACFLALGRALGETMAVTMLIGNVRYLNFSLFATGDSIASIIANQLNEAASEQRAALVTLGLLLFIITGITNLIARWLIRRAAKPRAQRPRKNVLLAGSTEAFPPVPPEQIERSRLKSIRRDRFMTWALGSCQLLTIGPLFLILGYITYRGVSGIDINLFKQLPKAQDTPGGGLGHAMLGSLMMVLTASAFAVPIGVITAVYLSEFRNHRLTKPVRFIAEILGGVPSIVIGIFAFAVLVQPFWTSTRLGFSGWAGVFALGVMMLPVVIRTSEEAMRLVPHALREASYALGATQWQTVVRVILPASLPAILTGVLLAMGRIAGETAPLLLTARGSNWWPNSLGDPTPFLPGYIFSYSKSAYADEQRQAWAASLVLLLFIMGLNIFIRLLAGKRQVTAAQAG